jgi:DNA recombination protein RmuC
MSPLELLFALLLVCVFAGTVTVAALVVAANRRAETQARDLAELRGQLAAGGQSQDQRSSEMRERLVQTQAAMEGIRSTMAAREQIEQDSRRVLQHLDAVIAGSATRGVAGENILEEALGHLPQEMVERNHWVGGKVVELGLRLPGGKVLPIDSKWTSSQALDVLSDPNLEPARRQQVAGHVEKEVERRIKEVSQYIDPSTTTPFAVAAVPDAAYSLCRSVFAEAHRRHVIVVGYSMALPYLLSLYQLHLQFSRSVDMENIQARLMDIDRQVESLEGVLENKLQRAVVMLQNAYSEGKLVSARIRATGHAIQVSEGLGGGETPEGLLVVEPAEAIPSLRARA